MTSLFLPYSKILFGQGPTSPKFIHQTIVLTDLNSLIISSAEDKTKEDLVHVLEPVDYVEYSYDETANCTTTSKSKKCQDHFKDQFDGDFYDYDTWTEPPEPKDQERTTVATTTTTRRPFTFKTKRPPKYTLRPIQVKTDITKPPPKQDPAKVTLKDTTVPPPVKDPINIKPIQKDPDPVKIPTTDPPINIQLPKVGQI